MHAIYVRVSTEEQAKHGYSLQAQLAACRSRLVKMNFSNIQEYVDDGYSGEFMERPSLAMLRNDLRAGLIESVMVYDPDRLSRNLTVQLILADEIEKAGARLLFVTGDYDASPEGRLFFAMKGAVAAYEKAKISERTTRGRRQKAEQGKIVFNARPFGYSWDKVNSMYCIDEQQAAIVRLIYDLFLSKDMGCRVIACELQNRGILGIKGKPLSAVTVYKILSREMYCGTHYLFRQRVRKTGQKQRTITNLPSEEWVPISVPAIISRDLWEKVQSRLKQHKKLAKRNCRHEYLLRGIIHCSHCGRGMVASSRPYKRKKTGIKIYSYYHCVTRESATYTLTDNQCSGMRIPAEAFDEEIWNILLSIVQNRMPVTAAIGSNISNCSSELIEWSKTHQDLLLRHKEIARLIRIGLLDAQAAEDELRSTSREIAAAKSAIQSFKVAKDQRNKLSDNISPRDILHAVTFAQKREIMLRSGFNIFAFRPNANSIEFYLE